MPQRPRGWLGVTVIAAFAAALAAPTVAVAATGMAAAPATASLAHSHRPTAVVSLGDSYISGEAGRWKGNAATTTPGRLGTDRAWRPTADDPAGSTDPTLVYGETAATGCHRSDVAPVKSAWLLTEKTINLACSGAQTVNVLRASAGGVPYLGELPQDDQLAAVATANQVSAIVLSIGGNDLGFGDVVQSCIIAYLYGTQPCSVTAQPAISAGLPRMVDAVGATIDDIRATMADAGYGTSDYRVILESYPTPTSASAGSRYSGTTPDARAAVGGCPFLDVDADWSHNSLMPEIRDALSEVAASRKVQFLDLSDAFRGHELCAATAAQSTGKPVSATSEWVRFVDLTGQGDTAESLHPNYFGQRALGQCLTLAALTRHNVSCHAVAHLPDLAVYLTPRS